MKINIDQRLLKTQTVAAGNFTLGLKKLHLHRGESTYASTGEIYENERIRLRQRKNSWKGGGKAKNQKVKQKTYERGRK